MYSSPSSQPALAHHVRKESNQPVTSLHDRLKAVSAQAEGEAAQGQQSPTAFETPKETRFLDVTAAFFSGPISHAKSQPLKKSVTSQIPRSRVSVPDPMEDREQQQKQQQKQQPQPQQQRAQSPTRSFNDSESPDARDLIAAVAAQSNYLYDEGITKLGELDKSLRGVRADTTNKDNQVLDRLRESTRKYCKPLSDTFLQMSHDPVDNVGVTNSKSVHVGERVAFIKGRLATLETEIDSLWKRRAGAQREVDLLVAGLLKIDEEGISNEPGSTTAVKTSLAQEVAKFKQELESILEDAHEEARAFEKDFSKSIQAVQRTFLQGYLLQ